MKTLFTMMSMAALVLTATPAFAVDCTEDADCLASEVCIDGVCIPNVLGCETDDDCTEGLVCVDSVCMPDPICATDDDCLDGELCIEGVCMPDYVCEIDADCLDGEICVAGMCVPEETGCTIDGDCAENEICLEGECVSDGDCAGCAPWQSCVVDTCTDPDSLGASPYGGDYIAGECHGTDYNGCCGNNVLYFCDDQSGECPLGDSCLVMLDCGAGDATCSWDADNGFFNCLAVDTPLPDDNGNLYCNWFDCDADCAGKACGSDGCGDSCGECNGDEGCTDAGQCEGCDALCSDLKCGSVSGCDCGTCEGDLQCVDGSCVEVAEGCAGACGGAAANGCFCDEQCAEYDDCCPDVCDECPELSHCGDCDPVCGDNVCGDDGCDGSCGDCADGEICDGGACVEDTPCVAACVGLCGMLGDCDCGGCADGEVCEVNTCVPDDGPCVPDCTDLDCGDDGCGGSCGDCADGEICDGGLCAIEIDEDVVIGTGCEDDDDCADGEVCNTNGECKIEGGGNGGDDGGGGGCATGDSVPTAGFMVLIGLLGLAVIRRRALV